MDHQDRSGFVCVARSLTVPSPTPVARGRKTVLDVWLECALRGLAKRTAFGKLRRPNNALQSIVMKPEIHPTYNTVKATCSCGNVIELGSTLSEDFHVDVCSKCHPFYTGKQKILDSGGRVERYRKRFGSRTATGTK